MRRWAIYASFVIAPVAYAQESNPTDAQRFYEEANALYQLQKYAEAIEKYESAYSISKEPAILLNIAQCYQQMKQYETALQRYRFYLEENPSEEERARVEQLISEVEDLQDQAAPTSTSEPALQGTLPNQLDKAPKPFPTLAVLYGSSATFGIISIASGVSALKAKNQAQESAVVVFPEEPSSREVDALLQKSSRAAIVSDISLGLAIGGAIGGYLFSKHKQNISVNASQTQSSSSLQVSFLW